MTPFMTLGEFAAFLGVSRTWVYTQIRSRNLRTRRIAGKLRFTPQDAEQFSEYQGGEKKAKKKAKFQRHPARLV